MRMRTRLGRLLPLVALAAGACTGGGSAGPAQSGDGDTVDLGNTQLIAALKPFDSCDDELAYLKEQALAVVGPYGINGLGPVGYRATGLAEDTASGGPTAGAPSTTAPTTDAASPDSGKSAADEAAGFSGTNVQEVGIDEPDIVKTDGQRIVAVAGNTLYVVDASGAEPVLVGSLALPDDEGYGGRIILDGDRALLLTQNYGNVVPVERDVVTDSGVAVGAPDYQPAPNRSKLVDIDLSNPAQPTITATLAIDGFVLDARQIGDAARVVVRSSPEQLPFVYPSSDSQAAQDKATEVNKQVIEASTIDDWLPHYTLTAGGDPVDGRLLECGTVSHPDTFSGFATLSVLTVDLTAELGPSNAVGVLADGETVYASASSLYVTTNRWIDPAAAIKSTGVEPSPTDEAYTTEIHQFDITGTGPAQYLASGAVDGHLLNSYSLSERDGFLRVATTAGTPWGGNTESGITVLTRDGEKLVAAGHLGGLGQGEQIFAVRYIGPVAYVVTFRQTDPLFVVDLSDPTNPVLAGELEINGYSAYLHPVGDGLLLGIGQDAGLQVSLFDVSDPANPTRLQQLVLGSGGSSAEYDPHAFLWWDQTGTAVLPVQTYGGEVPIPVEPGIGDGSGTSVSGGSSGATGAEPTTTIPPDDSGVTPSTPPAGEPPLPQDFFDGAIGIHVDPAALAEVGRVTHAGHAPEQWGPYGAPIERSLVIGDRLYTFSQIGIAASDLSTFAELAFVAFPVG